MRLLAGMTLVYGFVAGYLETNAGEQPTFGLLTMLAGLLIAGLGALIEAARRG